MKKILLTLIFGVFLISVVPAELGTFQEDKTIYITTNLNATSVNITIQFPNSSIAVENQPMTQLMGDIWNYTFQQANETGKYIFYYCDENLKNCEEDYFKVTYFGREITTPQAIIQGLLFFVLMFLFVVNVYGIGILPSKNEKDEDGKIISINQLKYLKLVFIGTAWILLMALMFISSNIGFAFLQNKIIGNFFFVVWQIMMRVTLPAIAIISVYFIAFVIQDKRSRKLIERGVGFKSKAI